MPLCPLIPVNAKTNLDHALHLARVVGHLLGRRRHAAGLVVGDDVELGPPPGPRVDTDHVPHALPRLGIVQEARAVQLGAGVLAADLPPKDEAVLVPRLHQPHHALGRPDLVLPAKEVEEAGGVDHGHLAVEQAQRVGGRGIPFGENVARDEHGPQLLAVVEELVAHFHEARLDVGAKQPAAAHAIVGELP